LIGLKVSVWIGALLELLRHSRPELAASLLPADKA
jgi:hypothetical protein